MMNLEEGIKTESFETSLANSEKTVTLAIDMFRKAGWHCVRLERVKGEDDYGDILIWKHTPDGYKYWFRTVDVKQNANWGDTEFPFRTIYLTANDQLHPDWWYIVFNNVMTRYAFVDMSNVRMDAVEYDETTNRRGGIQQSAGVPVGLAKFRRVK